MNGDGARLRAAFDARNDLIVEYRRQARALLSAAATLERSSPVELADAGTPVRYVHSSCRGLEDALDEALTAL